MTAQPHRTLALVVRAALLAVAVALVPLVMAGAATAKVDGYVGTWTRAQPSSAPAPRAFASMAFDQTSGRLIAFGGMDSAGNSLGDTWAWDGSDWQQLNVSGPSARWGASMAWDPALGAIVLFGGLDGICTPSGLNDTWEWKNETWTQVSIARPPTGYGLASMDFDAATGQMIIFGGTTQPGLCGLTHPVLTADTNSFDGKSWTTVATSGPSPRDRSSMGFDPRTGKMVLVGGFDEDRNALGDTWTWDGTAWKQEATSGPPSDMDGQMAFDGQTGRLVLFGGYDDDDRTWAWEGGVWHEQDTLTSPEGEIPGVTAHVLAYDPATSQLVLFGGNAEQEYSSQTWIFAVPTTGAAWSRPSVSGSPSQRIDDSIAYDPAIGRLVMFGGEDSSSQALNDTWVWDGSGWSPYAATNPRPARWGAALAYYPATGQLVLYGGTDAAGNLLGDTWVLADGAWTRVATSGPSPRTFAAMSFDPDEGKLVLFGGLQNGGAALGDTWLWDGSTWSDPGVMNPPYTAPSARYKAALSFDPATGQMLLFGGSASGGTALNDTWLLRAGHWYQLTASGGPSVTEADTPVMDFDAATGQMVLTSCCGGQPPWKEGEWTWNGTAWSARGVIDPTGSSYGWAGPGAGAEAAFDPGTGQFVLFGNYSMAGPFDDETWVLFPTLGTNLSITPASRPYSGTAEATASLTYGGARVPGEAISFARGGVALCGSGQSCPVTDAQGEATITGIGLSGLEAGTYGTGGTCAAAGITASFSARDGYASAAACGSLTVTKEQTQIVESTEPANPSYGQPFTVTIEVWPLGTATAVPAGSVFYQLTRNPYFRGDHDWSTNDPRNDYQKGTLTLDGTGTATYTTSAIVPAEYEPAGLAASFTSNDANVEGTFTQGPVDGAEVAISPADTATTVSVDPPLAGPGQSVDITATIVAPAGFTPLAGAAAPVGPVHFYDDGTEIASATPTLDPATGDYTATLTAGDLTLGAHPIKAVLDNRSEENYESSEGTSTAQVGQFPTTTSLTSSASPSVSGHQVAFTAKVAGPAGVPTPSGSVRFQVDGADVGAPVALDQAGEGSYVAADLGVGDHAVTVVYTPDTSLFTASQGELAGGQRVDRAAEPGDAHGAEMGSGGAAGSGPAPGDTDRCEGCAPELSRLRVSPRAFEPTGATGGGATVSYRDTLAARATLRVFGVRPGVVRAGRCVAHAVAHPRSAKRCAREVLVTTIVHADRSGRNQVPLTGRLHGDALAPGNYVLRASATLVGQTSPTLRAGFKVLPRPGKRHPA
jgi:hypothetical protein